LNSRNQAGSRTLRAAPVDTRRPTRSCFEPWDKERKAAPSSPEGPRPPSDDGAAETPRPRAQVRRTPRGRPEEIAGRRQPLEGDSVTMLLEVRPRSCLQLEDELHQASSARTRRWPRRGGRRTGAAGLKDPNRPIGSFIFIARLASGQNGGWRGRWPGSCSTTSGDDSPSNMYEYQEKHTVATR